MKSGIRPYFFGDFLVLMAAIHERIGFNLYKMIVESLLIRECLFFLMLLVIAIPNSIQAIDQNPYIYMSINHGQAMGLTFGKDTVYIGYDGYVQKVKEEYGMADTVQELKEGQLGKNNTLRLFTLLEKKFKHNEHNTCLQEIKSETKTKEKNKLPEAQKNIKSIPDYYPPLTSFEILTHTKKFYTKYYGSSEPDSNQSIETLKEVIDKILNDVLFSENKAIRFIRANEIKNKFVIEQYKEIIKEVKTDEIIKAKVVLLSILNENRLIPVKSQEMFYPLKLFFWPYELPYSVIIKVDNKVYSIRCKIKKGKG